jgi:hypothetical protein
MANSEIEGYTIHTFNQVNKVQPLTITIRIEFDNINVTITN